MKSIEKVLDNYIHRKGPSLNSNELLQQAKKDPNEVINTLFNVVSNEIDEVTGSENLDVLMNILKNVNTILLNTDNTNRKIVLRKIHKLYEKIERIKVENKKKFTNEKRAIKELDKIQDYLESMETVTQKENSKQFDFISYLINKVKSITYIEYTIAKMPSLINSKDKYDKTLFQNLVTTYISCVEEEDEDDILYYSNLITLVLSQKAFSLSDRERKDTLDILCEVKDKLSIDKKREKKNKNKIEWIKYLINVLKGIENKKDNEIDILANKYNIKVFFDEDLIEQSKLVKAPKEGQMTDREVIDDYIITIDGEKTKEIDDALSCKKLPNGNYELGVHIASILGYFPYGSEIVQEALSRNHSIYLPTAYQHTEDDFCRTVPIFPYAFSGVNASLIPGENKLARSYIFEIDSEGNIVNERFMKSIVNSNKKTTYNEINNVLAKGSDDKDLQETIMNLQEVTQILDKKYVPTKLYEQIKEYTDDYSDLRVKRVGAEKIVYQAMLLTGNRVAEFFANSNYPCLYRVHQVNEENVRKISALVDNLTKSYGGEQFAKLYQLIDGLYPKGWYATEGSHAGLGLEHYCHCTSGLRRAADIIVEHALEVCHDKTPTQKELNQLAEEIEKRCQEINSKEGPIEWFVKDYTRTYKKRR